LVVAARRERARLPSDGRAETERCCRRRRVVGLSSRPSTSRMNRPSADGAKTTLIRRLRPSDEPQETAVDVRPNRTDSPRFRSQGECRRPTRVDAVDIAC